MSKDRAEAGHVRIDYVDGRGARLEIEPGSEHPEGRFAVTESILTKGGDWKPTGTDDARAVTIERPSDEALRQHLRAAVERDELICYRDPDGMPRYAVADAVGLRAVALECGMGTVAEALGVPALADCDPDAEAVGGCIDTHIGEAIAPSDLPLLNALQQGLREAEDG